MPLFDFPIWKNTIALMQKTNFSRINDTLIIYVWVFNFILESKSINIISVLTGYFLFANFATKFISEGRNELMVPIIILIIELIIRINHHQVLVI